MSTTIQPQNNESEQIIPIACLLPPEEQEARGEDVSDLLAIALETHELPDGYGLGFQAADEIALRLLEFINFERKCCPFFKFELVFEPQDGPISLNIRGGEGVKELLRESLAFIPESLSHSE